MLYDLQTHELITITIALERLAKELEAGGLKAASVRNTLAKKGGYTHEDRIRELLASLQPRTPGA